MLRQRKGMGSDATARQESSATVSPTDRAIATVAYQLWLVRGCPIGSDREDWFRAEEMLNLLRSPAIPNCDTPAQPEMPATPPLDGWPGHWEIWEREWVCAHWVKDVLGSGVAASRYQTA
jgi:hypothetical protein